MENSDIVVIVVTDLKIWAQLYFIYIEKFLFFFFDFTLCALAALEQRNKIENNSQTETRWFFVLKKLKV